MRRAKAGDAIWESEGTYLLMRAEATCRCDTPVSSVVHLVTDCLNPRLHRLKQHNQHIYNWQGQGDRTLYCIHMRECDKLCRTRYDYCNRKQELPIVQPSVHSPYVVLSSCVMKSWRDIWDRNWGDRSAIV